MGQEPNINIEFEDRPELGLRPAAPARWKADRPGDLTSPGEVPWGGPFGTPGPDTGYALKLAAGAEMDLEPGEERTSVERTIIVLMAGRASHFGRAPTIKDLQFALLLLGLAGSDQVPEVANVALAKDRRYWAPRVAASTAFARQLAAHVPAAIREGPLEDVRHRLALGETPLAR